MRRTSMNQTEKLYGLQVLERMEQDCELLLKEYGSFGKELKELGREEISTVLKDVAAKHRNLADDCDSFLVETTVEKVDAFVKECKAVLKNILNACLKLKSELYPNRSVYRDY